MNVRLITHTPDPDKVVASAAKLCYSNTNAVDLIDSITDESAESFVQMLNTIGHESPIEHVSFTFAIDGVSRSLLAQITRHRLASFSVQSQRYVKLDHFEYIVPPEIQKIYGANEIFETTMNHCLESYMKLTDILSSRYSKKLIDDGHSEDEARKKAEKMAIEDARFVLPNACETKIVMTMNARELMHFFKMRCCNRAQWEIRELADKMLHLVKEISPALFKNAGPSCVSGKCSEGKMSCGNPKVRG